MTNDTASNLLNAHIALIAAEMEHARIAESHTTLMSDMIAALSAGKPVPATPQDLTDAYNALESAKARYLLAKSMHTAYLAQNSYTIV